MVRLFGLCRRRLGTYNGLGLVGGSVSRGSLIAMDGPVASGKTVVGRLLAQRLGYRFLDTGLMYRAVTWGALCLGIAVDDAASLTRLAQELDIQVREGAQGDQVLVDGDDVTGALRSSAVEEAVSLVSQVPGVREALVAKQRALAQPGGMVMVGRDIGTVVLKDAPVKVFLQASVEERARRRHRELLAQGQQADCAAVQRELEQRDRLDSQRVHAPLRPAPDAHIVNTHGIAVEEVVRRILALVQG